MRFRHLFLPVLAAFACTSAYTEDGDDHHTSTGYEVEPGQGTVFRERADDGPAGEEFDDGVEPRASLIRLIAAGDIAACDRTGDSKTAALLDDLYGTVVALGDNVYESGTAAEWQNCFGPTWGRHKSRIRPAVGNHEYKSSGAGPYFDYFGSAAGPRGKGWYSFRLGDWLIIALNSNCSQVGCGAGSEQERWLRQTLAANPTQCALAFSHHARASSGDHGNHDSLIPLWQALYDYGVDVVLSGHDHDYERFAKQDPWRNRDDARGIRQFVVGTGGKSLYSWGTVKRNSLVRSNDASGVLRLTLYPDRYYFKFIPVEGESFTDYGSRDCH
jgi:hypothetical protein